MDQARAELDPSREATRGVLALAVAFTTWGVLPLYLRLLRAVPPLQITAHRVLFCCVFVLGFLRARGALYEVRAALADPPVRRRLIASSVLIAINWLVFVWAISNDRVVEASLGYYINPLVNVVLGVVVLREQLRRIQWLAVGAAAVGVSYLTWYAGAPPWIALTLALSFGSYGLIRKTVAVDSMAGLAAETLLTLPIAAGYLAFCELRGDGAFRHGDPFTLLLLALSGGLTMIPLWLFAYGARRVRLATVGLLQYIGPTLSLGFGIWIFGEPFPPARALGFLAIWTGLVLYAVDSLRQRP
ncbi:MAG TPA: EamA family transporter RarD [Polyangiales bacterium]|nr:EamA family transporter RarD [Polyangiales bacterium]